MGAIFRFFTGKFGKMGSVLIVVLALALAVLSFKLYAQSDDLFETKNELQDKKEELASLKKKVERLKANAAINKEVKENLRERIDKQEQSLEKIRDRADGELDKIKEQAAKARQSMNCDGSDGGQDGQDNQDYDRAAADTIVDGMWDAYQNSLQDTIDSAASGFDQEGGSSETAGQGDAAESGSD